MDNNLPLVYLSILIVLLAITAVFVLRQIIKTRQVENTFNRLQNKLQKEKGTAQEYYELGSLYLDKKLYVQAVNLLQKALKAKDEVEPENLALIYNALGYTYFAQEQLDLAIRHYKDAINLFPSYAIALNNLANTYERKQMTAKALETYEETLKVDPQNVIAKRRAESLRKRLVNNSSSSEKPVS
jgi:tetratricopeptide (TPR) repeat protein